MTYRIWLIFMQPVENLKICTLTGLFTEHIKFQMKNYRRVVSHGTEKWSKEKLILEKYSFFCVMQ